MTRPLQYHSPGGLRIVHLLAGLGETSGVANIARRFARVQRQQGDQVELIAPRFKWNPLYFGFAFVWRAWRAVRAADEVWVHCSWTFPVWFGAWLAKRYGKRLVVVPEASFDPLRLNNHASWKKRLVSPLDRWVLRVADEVCALCPDEVGWVQAFEPAASAYYVQVPLFIPASAPAAKARRAPVHVLFLGRAADPLKGLRFLAQAVSEVNCDREGSNEERGLAAELRVVADHTGEKLAQDWAWCDVLCLPTLSDNFGLVVAEALERGKPVITTDGAAAWNPDEYAGEECWWRARVHYLRGYREGNDRQRIELLKAALKSFCVALS